MKAKDGRSAKIKIVLLLLCCSILFTACAALSDKPHHVGRVVDINLEERKILVISTLTDEEIETLDVEEMLELDRARGQSAVWYSGGGIKYEIGDRVQVWIRDGIDDGYPGQARAKKVVKYEIPQFEKWW